MSNTKRNVQDALIQIGAGGSAGFLEACLMHPLDLIKTRMQLQSTRAPVLMAAEVDHLHYSGIYDCLRKMYRHEGLLSFWKGILPPIAAETPKRAIKFFTFEQYKEIFKFGSTTATPLVLFLAGAAAGVTEAIIINPFEVVKVSLQSDRNKVQLTPSTWSVTKRIVKNDGLGLRGLNKGLFGTIWRNGVFNSVYFGFYHSVNNMIPPVTGKVENFTRKLTIGFMAGTLASCLNIPFDVAKSRMQGPQPNPGQVKYRALFPTLYLICREEGWRALFKGLLPKIMRLGPGGAIMLVMYDFASDFLRRKFQN